MTGRRILVVDDDPSAREILSAALKGEGFVVRAASDSRTAETEAEAFRPHLALIDIDLGQGADGFSTARRLRNRSAIALMFLTAKDQPEDRLAAFAVGADDFVAKPFSFRELIARMEAVLRRAGVPRSNAIAVGDLVLDHDSHTAQRGGAPLELTAVEFSLLEALMRRPGLVVPKPQLLSEVWGFDHYDVNIVEVYTSSLRRKLEVHGPRLIHTVRGVGYLLRPA